ncbi:helix-turn-helix domain-containing protein [Carnobacterium mobile]|uniref:helix-turn-helix domain-containing protein n=1 Tax=Carnobacterium mobile TaxID=2750 RepID=UPI00055402AB|nr:helix-turn-helix domain-containing protein [Carnobacterium mobile]
MAQLSFEVSSELEKQIEGMVFNTAKNVLAELEKREPMGKPYMNLKECCQYVGCSNVTLNDWIRERKLQVIKIGGKKYIAKITIDQFMMNHQK